MNGHDILMIDQPGDTRPAPTDNTGELYLLLEELRYLADNGDAEAQAALDDLLRPWEEH